MSNIDAFLSMIAFSEGTADLGDRGYNCIVGSNVRQQILFSSYSDHPRIRVQLRPDLVSSAAGRYQILARIFDAYKISLRLQDFSPESQDLIALQMIRECNAFMDVAEGRFDAAVTKCASRWASLPGAGYQQHENELAALKGAYINAGGVVA